MFVAVAKQHLKIVCVARKNRFQLGIWICLDSIFTPELVTARFYIIYYCIREKIKLSGMFSWMIGQKKSFLELFTQSKQRKKSFRDESIREGA